jgi:hypothetical protein
LSVNTSIPRRREAQRVLQDGWTWLAAIAIAAIAMVGIASPLLSRLRADELFFLHCAYSAVNFDGDIAGCHFPATFAKVLMHYVEWFGLEGAVLGYKLTVAVLTATLFFWLLLGFGCQLNRLAAVSTAFVLAVWLYYIASTRGIEIRQEFLGITGLFLGASPLTGRSHLLLRNRAPLPTGFVLAQLALSAAALMSLRLALPALALGMALLMAHLRVNDLRLFSNAAFPPIAASATLALVTLAVFHWLFLDLQVQLDRIVDWSPPPLHQSTWQRTFLDIGLVEQIRRVGWDAELWRYQRLALGIGVIGMLAAISYIQRDWPLLPERALIAGALLASWFMLTVEAQPFAYVVAIEGTLVAIAWCVCLNGISSRSLMRYFLAASVAVALLLAVQSTYSNARIRNMTIPEFVRGYTELDGHATSETSTPDLIRKFRHRHFLVQLAARQAFCERFAGFVVLAKFGRHPLCLRDAGSAAVWTGKIAQEDIPDIAQRYPRFIIGGYPQVVEDAGFELEEIGKEFFAKRP